MSFGLTAEQASARARKTGKDVGATAATTESSTLTAHPNGTLTLTQSLAPVRKRVGDVWKKLDPTLHKDADGSVSTSLTGSDLALSGGGTGPLATMDSYGRSLAVSLPMRLPAPALSGATATYSEVLKGVDLKVTADAQGGFSEVLVVKNAQAAANPALKKFTLATHADGLGLSSDRAGNITAADRAGHPVFTAPAPQMWDSASSSQLSAASVVQDPITGRRVDRVSGLPVASSVQGPGKAAHHAAITAKATGKGIDLTPSASLLTSPKTVYPLYIDPSFTAPSAGSKLQAWTQTNSYYHGSSYWKSSDLLRVGDQDWDSPVFTARSFVQVGVPSQIYGSTVLTSQLNFTEEWSPSCTAKPVQLWKTGTISSSTTWDNPPSMISEVDSQSHAYGWSSSCPAANIGFDIGDVMQSAANSKTGNLTFGLKAGDESDKYGWKEFADTITVSTTYDHKPDTPTHLTTSPSTSCQDDMVVGDGNVTLYAGTSDSDGGTLGTSFKLTTHGSGTVVDQSDSNSLTGQSGSTAVYVIPKADLEGAAGGKVTEFDWNVAVSDFKYFGGTSTTCHFSFDPTRTGPPVIAQPTSSTVGQPLSVSIAPPGKGTTPSSYEYQLNGGAPVNVTADSSGDATITVTPTRHTNVLSVSSLSAGSNYGDTAAVHFDSANPASAQADGDLTGDSIPDLLTVGGKNGLSSGLWLANGASATGNATPSGHVVSSPVDIGVNGSGLTSNGSPSDFDGAIAFTGAFTDSGFQDVLVYYPSGSNAGTGAVLSGNGDGSALNTRYNEDVKNITSGSFQDIYGDDSTPVQLANAGTASDSGSPYPDLIGVSGNATNGYALNLYQAQATIRTWIAFPLTVNANTPDGTADWNNWTLSTMQLPASGGGSSTAMFLWNKSTGQLHLWENLAADPYGGTLTYTDYPIATGFHTGQDLTLQAADINGDGTPDLWTTGTSATTTANLFTSLSTTSTAALSQNTDILSTPSHTWALNDAQSGSITTATDSSGALNATGSGDADWTAGDLFSPAANFQGTGSLATTSQTVSTNSDFTVSAWVKPTALGGYVLGQKGTHTSGFALFSDAATKSWRFEMPTADTNSPTEDTADAATIPAQVGAWVRLTATYQVSTGRMTLYLNDVAAAQATHTTKWNAIGPLTMGAYLYNGTLTGHFSGDVSDVETYPQALNAKQVAVLAGNPGPTSYAHINDGHDFNNDSNADVIAQWANGSLHLYTGAPGSQLVSGGQLWDSSWATMRLMAAGNFTDSQDDNADVVAIWSDGTAHLYTSDGNGHLTNAGQLTGGATWGTIVQIATGDFNGDGHTDLLTIWGDGSVHVYPGDGKGNIGSASANIWPDKSWSSMKLLGAGDYNNDGHCDLLAEWSDGSLHLYTGDGNSHLTQSTQMYGGNTWTTVKGIIPGDFNHDGLTDLVAVWGDGTVHLYTGDGNGHLAAGSTMWPDNTWNTMGLIA
ncbi:FG-GAP-like repeat-containing protein [Streptomyces sp. NPDC047022]|uniref:FG-GAP-like repeat-containing protein n=1 Tax=Streptomyces sp. NPDC047022 TaxID=3155737 RepID=UPI0033F695E5